MTDVNLLAEYVDRDNLARILNVSPRTISRYSNQPDGLPFTRIGGRTYFRLEAVRAWLAGREKRPNQRRGAA